MNKNDPKLFKEYIITKMHDRRVIFNEELHFKQIMVKYYNHLDKSNILNTFSKYLLSKAD